MCTPQHHFISWEEHMLVFVEVVRRIQVIKMEPVVNVAGHKPHSSELGLATLH